MNLHFIEGVEVESEDKVGWGTRANNTDAVVGYGRPDGEADGHRRGITCPGSADRRDEPDIGDRQAGREQMGCLTSTSK